MRARCEDVRTACMRYTEAMPIGGKLHQVFVVGIDLVVGAEVLGLGIQNDAHRRGGIRLAIQVNLAAKTKRRGK